MAGDVLGLQVEPSSAFKELEEHAKRGEELHSKRARGEAGIRQFQSDVTRWTNQAEGLMRSLYLADAPGFLRWRELLDGDRASPAPDDLEALEEQIHDELAERVDLLTSLMTEIRLRHDASAAPPDVEQHADEAPTYQLPDEVRALLSYALAICAGRGSSEVTGLDVVLAALARDSSQRPSDPGAATYRLTATMPQQPPPQARVKAALSSLGVDSAAAAFQRTIDPLAEAALDTALAAADALRSEVGGGWLWSHHVVGSALVALDLPQPVAAALGATADDLRGALREGIAQRWPDEDQPAWDRLLGPADAILAMHGQARQRLELAVALTRSRGGTATDDADVLFALLSSDERLPTVLLDPEFLDPVGPRLTEAMVARYGPQLPTIGGQLADPTLRSLTVVHRATAVARATMGEPIVQIEHLLAVAVTGDMAADVLDRLGIDEATLRERALAWILTVVPPETADRWTAMMTSPPAELSGIFASDRVRWGRRSTEPDDQPLVDHLGVDVYVTMLATLIARRSTPMPVSIGLFGEWGSGKSYFMELVRQKVADLAKDAAADAKSPYCGDVLQMTFNAWHYSDTNLWASLAFEFFEQLGGKGSVDELTMRREEVQRQLSKAQQVRSDLELSKQRATAQTTALRRRLADATREREHQTARFDRKVLEALAADEDIKEQIAKLAGGIGLEPTDGEAVLRLARDVAATGDDLAATRKVLAHKRLWIPFALLVLTVGLVGLALALGDDVMRWLRGGAVLATTAFVADVGLVVGRSRRLVGGFRGLAEHAASVQAQVIKQSPGVRAVETKLRAAEAAETVAGARLDEVVGLIGELDRQLVELSPDRNLYRFLAERSASYQNQLGIVSLLRRDFESLVSLMREWRTAWAKQEQHDEKRKPIDRIVLYIDDLDRCEPEQVVTVLQAVHLLLAMDLFVVVVGVDPRWLLRSLRRRYRRVLGASGKGDREAGFRESTPQNYLEKIFQVPFVLPSMDDRGFAGLLDHLTKPAPLDDRPPSDPVQSHESERPTTEARPESTVLTEPASPSPTATMTAQPRSEVAAVVLGTGQPEATPISTVELALLAALSGLVRTPRAATRLVNIYGMLRSTRDLTEGGSFLDRPGRPGDYQAVVQLLGILSGAPELLGPLLWGRLASGAVEHRALCRTNPPKTWRVFVEQLSPREANGSWCNAVSDHLSAAEVEAWRVLVDELRRLHEYAELDDIEPFRKWGPLVARFSFLLSAFANDEPDLVTAIDA